MNRDENSIHLELPSNVASGRCTALQVYVHCSEGGAPALVYSGHLGSSGFSYSNAYIRFDKFRARSFLVGLCPPAAFDWNDFAPIVIPAVIPVVAGSHPGSDGVTLQLHFVWQTVQQLQDWPAMSWRDICVFLQKGLTAAPSGGLPPPRSTDRSVLASSGNWALTKHSPRPLSSYGFLVDYLLHTNEEEPCFRDITSRFYEPADFYQYSNFASIDAYPVLKFDIPRECIGMVPTIQSFEYEGTYLEAVVYVVDKETGMQAKLFQGQPCDYDEEGFDGTDYFFELDGWINFDEFAVSSFFDGVTVDSKNLGGCFPMSVGKLFRGAAELMIELDVRYFEDNSIENSRILLEEEFLTFLEKGLSWGTYTPGNRRG